MDDNNDPIKDYGTSRISKLFGDEDLSGRYESEYEKDYKKDTNISAYNKDYSKERKLRVMIAGIFSIFMPILIGIIFMILALTMNTLNEKKADSNSSMSVEEKIELQEKEQEKIEKIESEYSEYNFSRLTSISFDNGITIPTLYKYSQKDDMSSKEYNYSDRRFGQNVSTVEIVYSSEITPEEIEEYVQALKRRNYKLIETNDVGENIYAYNDNTKGAFAFVIIGNTRVVYGVGTGRYSRIFN